MDPKEETPAAGGNPDVSAGSSNGSDGTTPAASPTPATGESSSEQLYKLPDGREVDAATLHKEFTENFLPEFTRRSQKLSELESGNSQNNKQEKEQSQEPKWKDPAYVPQTYAEVIEFAKQEALNEIAQRAEAEKVQLENAQKFIDSEIAEIRKTEPNLSEELLFQHANKYGFTNLRTAYQNMKDMNMVVEKTREQATKDAQARATEPIATVPGAGQSKGEGIDPNVASRFESAVEYLRSLKGS